jgi:hypothetical protein
MTKLDLAKIRCDGTPGWALQRRGYEDHLPSQRDN